MDAAESPTNPPPEPAARDWIGRLLGPYRLLSLVARGGMGEVYRGERADGQYHQQVALKVMREGGDEGPLLARFNAERRILASLDHPNLARLLDAGVSPEGAPYFVMELVDGMPIDAYCEQQRLAVEQRLRLMRSVCQVVEYAHRQGVIHRDLKPANILVTRDGVVKLVDFGIAKRVGLPGEPGVTSRQVLTPEYASPEQIRGAALTPASDTYALGVVLYRLLTHAGPYREAAADSYALTRAICETEPARPSRALRAGGADSRSLRRRLRGDLDAVALMALRKDPARRYASAEALSDDLFRHLEGLPVQARRGAWSYRAGRFVLRHRVAVGGALLANLALVAGIAATAYQAYEAHLQRQRAERHFASVRQLAHVFIFDVHDAIQDLPGAMPARKRVVEHAMGYLRELSADPASDAALRTEIAAGYRKVGDIQGRPFGANLGDPRGAKDSYDKARSLLEPLLAPSPERAETRQAARRELVVVHKRLGALADSLGQLEQADGLLRAGIALAAQLVAAEPANQANQALLAAMHGQLSQLKFYAGDFDAYLKASDVEFRWLDALVAQHPEDDEAVMSLSIFHDLRGQYLAQRDASAESGREALSAFRNSMSLKQALLDKQPANAHYLRMAASEHLNIGVTLTRIDESRQAIDEYRRGIEMLAVLAAKDPSNMDARQAQALASNNLSGALFQQGDLTGSASAALTAVNLFASLPEGARLDVAALRIQGRSHYHLGRALEGLATRRGPADSARAKGLSEACHHYRRGLAILEDLQGRVGLAPNQLHPDTLRQALRPCPTLRKPDS